MIEKNIMEIDTLQINNTNSIVEYKRLWKNYKIGESLRSFNTNASLRKTLYLSQYTFRDLSLKLESKYQIFYEQDNEITIIADDFIAELFLANTSDDAIRINIASSSIKKCDKAFNQIKTDLQKMIIDKKVVSYQMWQYGGDEVASTFIDKDMNLDFNEESFPYIMEVDNYIETFMKSSAPILIFYGEPGTGKSTFANYTINKMKHLSQKDEFNVVYSSDEDIFYSKDFYHKLVAQNPDVVVFEDMGTIWNKNAEVEGRSNLTKFIALSDGLVSITSKIIIITNIESRHQMNAKLTRPGRCHDMIKFRKLQGVEIDNLCDSYDRNVSYQIDSMNLSEFFAMENRQPNIELVDSSIGF